MKIKIIITVLLLSAVHQTFSQSIVEEAKYLALFDQLLTSRADIKTKAEPTLLSDLDQRAIAQEVLKLIKSSPLQQGQTAQANTSGQGGGTSQAGIVLGTSATGSGASPQGPVQGNVNSQLDNLTLQQIQKEIKFIIDFLDPEHSIFEDDGNLKAGLQNFPSSFTYLQPIVKVMASNEVPSANLSTLPGLGSIVTISQAEILKGIADWALERAQEELMQAFLRNWLDRIEKDSMLQKIFPNTAGMLKTKPLTSFFTDGDAWKTAFQQDFEELPPNIPDIVDTALTKVGEPIDLEEKEELIAGLQLTVELFDAIGKNKRPEEMLQILSQKALGNAKSLGHDEATTIDRITMAVGILVSSIQIKNGSSTTFANANTLLSLSENELKLFWELLFLRKQEHFQYIFKLKTNASTKDFYEKVRDKYLVDLQTQLGQISETIQALNTIRQSSNGQQNVELNAEKFHQYADLTFEFLESGVTTLERLGVDSLDLEKVKAYRHNYFELYRNVSQIIEGISTKRYGKTVLNTVNLLLWMDTLIPNKIQSIEDIFKIEDFKAVVNDNFQKDQVETLFTELNNLLDENLSEFSETQN